MARAAPANIRSLARAPTDLALRIQSAGNMVIPANLLRFAVTQWLASQTHTDIRALVGRPPFRETSFRDWSVEIFQKPNQAQLTIASSFQCAGIFSQRAGDKTNHRCFAQLDIRPTE